MIFLTIIKHVFLGAQKDLIETVLLSTHNIYFGWELNKENVFSMRTLIWRPD